MLIKALRTLIVLLALTIAALGLSTPGGSRRLDRIGIFDLQAIRSTPLAPEILATTRQGDVVIQQVRFTSLPGVRIYAILTYRDGATNLPGITRVERFGAKPMVSEAQNNFFGMTVEPPTGNTDPKKMASVGGPKLVPGTFSINDAYTDDPNDSYIYQYTVALIRAMDYLATRPEVNLSNTVVVGYSWAGTMVSLLHALDNRPAAFIVFHGLGQYVDENGNSGNQQAPISRKKYEMYCPAAYASYGTKPIYVGTALDDYYTKLDAIIEMYTHLQCPKAFAYVPNRQHSETARHELDGNISWIQYWQLGGDKPTTVGDGAVTAEDGRAIYSVPISSRVPLAHADVLVSYGKPGNWIGRTWHRFLLAARGDTYRAEIPVYDPKVPFYALAEIQTAQFGVIANGPQLVQPDAMGISSATSSYPTTLFEPTHKDDLYLRTGQVEWLPAGANGRAAAMVTPGDEGTISFQNIDPELWKGRTALTFWLKGDGQRGPITAYFAYHSDYFLELGKGNYTAIPLVPKGETFASGWREYVVPLSRIKHLEEVSQLFLATGGRPLRMGTILLK